MHQATTNWDRSDQSLPKPWFRIKVDWNPGLSQKFPQDMSFRHAFIESAYACTSQWKLTDRSPLTLSVAGLRTDSNWQTNCQDHRVVACIRNFLPGDRWGPIDLMPSYANLPKFGNCCFILLPYLVLQFNSACKERRTLFLGRRRVWLSDCLKFAHVFSHLPRDLDSPAASCEQLARLVRWGTSKLPRALCQIFLLIKACQLWHTTFQLQACSWESNCCKVYLKTSNTITQPKTT